MNLSVIRQQRSLFRKRILFRQILNLRLNFRIKFSEDEVRIIFYSTENILVKPEAAADNLKTYLFGLSEKSKKLSKEIQLKLLTLAYESFSLYHNENMITEARGVTT